MRKPPWTIPLLIIIGFAVSFWDVREVRPPGGRTSVNNRLPSIIIVPHHLLAAPYIDETIASLKTDKPVSVLLISPNHFTRGNGGLITDNDLIANDQITVEPEPLKLEHGINNLVPFVNKYLPNAKIIPLMTKDWVSAETIDQIAENLYQKLPKDSIVIGSFDFSHYLPQTAADFHDAKAQTVLEQLDFDGTNFLDIDSKPGLRLVMRLAEKRGYKTFDVTHHSNSALIVGKPDLEDTTSHFTGFFTTNNPPDSKVTMLLVGDMMLDRKVRAYMNKYGAEEPFKLIERFLEGSDLVLANLEGPFSNFKPLANPERMSFTFDPKLIPILKKFGFSIFNLANNHTLDFGEDGAAQNKSYLTNNDIPYFGDPRNENQISTVQTIRGLRIGFVGYQTFRNPDPEPIIAEIKRLRPLVDYLVVYAHWGNEYQTSFAKSQQSIARDFIDAGADVIFGSHPHVIEPMEIYKNKPIFYSLGNFLFDQYFSAETQEELSVGVVWSKETVDYYLFPLVYNSHKQLELADPQKSATILQKANLNSNLIKLSN